MKDAVALQSTVALLENACADLEDQISDFQSQLRYKEQELAEAERELAAACEGGVQDENLIPMLEKLLAYLRISPDRSMALHWARAELEDFLARRKPVAQETLPEAAA